MSPTLKIEGENNMKKRLLFEGRHSDGWDSAVARRLCGALPTKANILAAQVHEG
jgi:hypothetical protein